MAYQPGPNNLVRATRLALRSPSGSGRPMSRQELAEAVNAYLYEHTGRRTAIAARYIGTLERGDTRWPSAHYRTALRAVLGKTTDAELGFFIIQGHANDPEATPAEPPPPAESAHTGPSDLPAALPPAVALHPAPTDAAGSGIAEPAETAPVKVSVNEGAAVTVVYHDGPPGRVAVVAGQVEVLIDPPGVDPASVIPVVVGPPMVDGGPRVCAISEQRAR